MLILVHTKFLIYSAVKKMLNIDAANNIVNIIFADVNTPNAKAGNPEILLKNREYKVPVIPTMNNRDISPLICNI
jgi:hypothetical protein